MDGANQCQPYSLSPKSEYMAGIKSKVELSSLTYVPRRQEMKIEGLRQLIDRPIDSLDDLFRQEASILRVLEFEAVLLKIIRLAADAAISAAEEMSPEERGRIWALSGVNHSSDRHDVYPSY
jgi:hypothetical protein